MKRTIFVEWRKSTDADTLRTRTISIETPVEGDTAEIQDAVLSVPEAMFRQTGYPVQLVLTLQIDQSLQAQPDDAAVISVLSAAVSNWTAHRVEEAHQLVAKVEAMVVDLEANPLVCGTKIVHYTESQIDKMVQRDGLPQAVADRLVRAYAARKNAQYVMEQAKEKAKKEAEAAAVAALRAKVEEALSTSKQDVSAWVDGEGDVRTWVSVDGYGITVSVPADLRSRIEAVLADRKAQRKAEMVAWAKRHGTEHLLSLIAQGYASGAQTRYISERAALELGAERLDVGGTTLIRTPSEKELAEELRLAEKLIACGQGVGTPQDVAREKCRIVRYTVEEEEEEGESVEHRAVVTEWTPGAAPGWKEIKVGVKL